MLAISFQNKEKLEVPGFNMLREAKILEASLNHDGQSSTKSLTLFHAGRKENEM
jgi:hypothetical protein